MKSRASIKGHPIHPILVGFPITLLVATFVADLVALINAEHLYRDALYLEVGGIIMGLVAAVPGFIDYLFTIPANSSGKIRGTQHALLNVSMLVLFAIALYIRRNIPENRLWVVLVEGLGIIPMVIAGWMGGTLVYRNQIGVYNRYANGGKWKEAYMSRKDNLFEVATKDELKLNQMKLVHVNGERIVVGNTENGYVAFSDHCSHKGGSLAGGVMICGTVQCPWHGSQFDVRNGMVKAGPAKTKIDIYQVIEEGSSIYVRL